MPCASQAPKLWPAVPLSLHPDGVVRQAGVAVALGDLARQHRAGGAVDVAGSVDSIFTGVPRSSAGLRLGDQLAVEDVVDRDGPAARL